MTKIHALSAALLATTSALAHDGHGQVAAHWHATDTVGMLLVASLAALAVWVSRSGK